MFNTLLTPNSLIETLVLNSKLKRFFYQRSVVNKSYIIETLATNGTDPNQVVTDYKTLIGKLDTIGIGESLEFKPDLIVSDIFDSNFCSVISGSVIRKLSELSVSRMVINDITLLAKRRIDTSIYRDFEFDVSISLKTSQLIKGFVTIAVDSIASPEKKPRIFGTLTLIS